MKTQKNMKALAWITVAVSSGRKRVFYFSDERKCTHGNQPG
jgi:hypothetical protein